MAKPKIRVSKNVQVQREQSLLARFLWFVFALVLFFISLGFFVGEDAFIGAIISGVGFAALLNALSRYRDLN